MGWIDVWLEGLLGNGHEVVTGGTWGVVAWEVRGGMVCGSVMRVTPGADKRRCELLS